MANLPRIPRSDEDDFERAIVAERRELCERTAGSALAHLGGAAAELESARGNVENLIGFAQVPVGIAGPLLVDTSAGKRELYVPMATNEGALVASHSRGMRLLASGGGARSRVLHEGLTQNPMLMYADAEAAARAAGVVDSSFKEFEALVASTSKHGRLTAARPQVLGNRLIVQLVFTTGDAIGINMAARAADAIAAEIERKTGARGRYVHGQDVEKRANSRGMLEGRGRSVVADVTLTRAALATLARVTPEQMVAIHAAYAIGFAQLGTHNWLVQAANGLAAVMLACGQDIAYLPECATGILDFQVTASGDLYASATLPSLLVGTVGGGSNKGTAAECLALLGCLGPGHANTFAEILGAVVLAGDLSLMASFCTHEFVAAHERLGRNRPAHGR
jgi:hydroxymethylglutaryl-CoA reductase (NADPH)